MEKKTLSPIEAAEMLGMTDHAIRRKLREKRLNGTRIGSHLIVYHDAVFQKELALRKSYRSKIGDTKDILASSGRPSGLTSVAREVAQLRKEISELKELILNLSPSSKKVRLAAKK